MSSENELPYLKLIGEGINSGKFLGIYPQGSAIPVRLANGKIDYAGQYDPTDKKKRSYHSFNDYMSCLKISLSKFYTVNWKKSFKNSLRFKMIRK